MKREEGDKWFNYGNDNAKLNNAAKMDQKMS